MTSPSEILRAERVISGYKKRLGGKRFKVIEVKGWFSTRLKLHEKTLRELYNEGLLSEDELDELVKAQDVILGVK